MRLMSCTCRVDGGIASPALRSPASSHPGKWWNRCSSRLERRRHRISQIRGAGQLDAVVAGPAEAGIAGVGLFFNRYGLAQWLC